MDRFMYSVPITELKEKVHNVHKQLHATFVEHCELLKSTGHPYDTYNSTLIYDTDLQFHLQNLYYNIDNN